MTDLHVKVLVLFVAFMALADGSSIPNIRRQKRQEVTADQPMEVLNWPSVPLDVGQISGVSVDQQSNPVILHRGHVVWDGSSFDGTKYKKIKDGPIGVDTILELDQRTGTPVGQWGRDLFYMPHGLHIDDNGNTWVTDVALHQVLKFPKGSRVPSLTLGEAFVSGSDAAHFCMPTDVAVASNGVFFVADGYCNKRIMKYDPNGTLLETYTGSFNIPHSLTLIEDKDLLCVADRENSRVVCLRSGLKDGASFRFGHPAGNTRQGSLGRVYAVASNGQEVFAVTGESFPFRRANGYSLNLDQLNVIGNWSPSQGFGSPHDVSVSKDGSSLYAVQIGPNRITKFALN